MILWGQIPLGVTIFEACEDGGVVIELQNHRKALGRAVRTG